ncbi:uncharacterized protein LOC141653160 [Silene latifolia]|uniref:uncharacterized protein LOC141653160 n=1 Tax=Silene latifolia TaxID=37657 RepID=UPI003D77F721
MARNSSSKTKSKHASRISKVKSGGKSSIIVAELRKKGPFEEEIIRTKSMQEVNGIPGLSFDDDEEESPIETNLWITKRGKRNVLADEDDENSESLIQFTKEDTHEEVEYWNNAVYCFVLGANPPWEVLNGFVHRIWQKHNIDKVSFMPNEIFLVRFKEAKDREDVLNAGHFKFDNKPLIVRPWDANVDLTQEDVKNVPAWIRIHDLPLRFWGKCLPVIAGLVGKFHKADQATIDKTRLGFARVMVELTVGKKFPNKVRILDEEGKVITLNVEYEWKPYLCGKCNGIGHESTSCRKEITPIGKKPILVRKVWKPVLSKVQQQPVRSKGVEANGEQLVPITVDPEVQRGSTSASDMPRTPEKYYKEAVDNKVTPKVGIGQSGLFGFCEIKINGNNVHNVSSSMLDGWSVITNIRYHKGGRVWMLWKPSLFNVQIQAYDAQFIHASVTYRITQQHFYLTMIYAFNDWKDRRELGQHLESIQAQCQGPWALTGDFNTVINPAERLGGNTKQCDMDEFIECLAHCGMTDITATGAYYTWTNKQEPQTRMYSRLDRFIINQKWGNQFPDMVAHFHHAGLFDHSPCIVSHAQVGTMRRASFKYFNMWGKAPSFIQKVQMVWQQEIPGHKMFSVVKNLKDLKPVLKEINKECFSDIENTTVLAEKDLYDLQLQLE